jgi:pimeloyl-ACP methyl ester carboxylesterase
LWTCVIDLLARLILHISASFKASDLDFLPFQCKTVVQMSKTPPTDIRDFVVSIPETDLHDLYARLRMSRLPDKETVTDWSQGATLHAVRDLCVYWQSQYSWRRCESLLNSWPQFTTAIDNVEIYFLHIRAKHMHALPLLLTHGWPGSILEFRHVIGPLTDPEAHGGQAEDAFHLVIPAIPGYAFSGKPTEEGWDYHRVARAWIVLMERLGYVDWIAQGGDWGADVTASLGNMAPKGLKGVHMNSLFFDAAEELKTKTHDTLGAQKAKDIENKFLGTGSGYFKQQSTRPQTLGYALADSPIGQAAWIYEQLHDWSHHAGNVEDVFSKDEMLDTIMLYWLSNTSVSSARLYWECKRDSTAWPISIPVGVSWFPGDISYAPREWAQRYYSRIVHWRELDKGGHFAAWEVPDLFVEEIREWARNAR